MPRLHFSQLLPAPLNEVFEFHADPNNLLKITPASLNLIVKNPQTVKMATGEKIHYTLKLAGIPLPWTSEITWYDPPQGFTDMQIKGPYKVWKHTHHFEAKGDQTLVTDNIEYEVPLGMLGRLFAGKLVERQLMGIFAYRAKVLEEHFRPKT